MLKIVMDLSFLKFMGPAESTGPYALLRVNHMLIIYFYFLFLGNK